MFSRKSKFSRDIFFFALISIFLIIGGCKNISSKKDTDTAKQKPAKQKIERQKAPPKTIDKKSVKTETQAEEIPDDGYIRLVLNEKKGCFTLYYLSDPQKVRYEPLFNPNDTAASFLSVLVDGEIYNLGSSPKFKTRIERDKKDTALIFESSFLKVTQVFSPVRTTNSQAANGVKITMTIQNTGTQRSFAGLRMLIDTNLGEGRNGTPILTNTQVVKSELEIDGHSGERYWISRGKKVSLMGSIVNPVECIGKGPDIVHIANWKRLRDAPWRLAYLQGRSFNNMPYSSGDSAICYYFGPEMLDRNKILTYTVFLTTEDTAWYNNSAPQVTMTASIISETDSKTAVQQRPVQPKVEELLINIPAIEAQAQIEAMALNENPDVITLMKLQEILNQFVDGQITLRENDLAEIERAIEKYRIRN